MTCHDKIADEHARRFRDAALPCLDDAYTLARFLMRNRSDAEDAVQECYLRALRHFDSWRGLVIKPWLFAILRNICYAELARRGRQVVPLDPADGDHPADQILWQEPVTPPDSSMLKQQEGEAIRKLVAALPAQFREAIVLREFNDMSYREIAEVTGVPVGTVMSRLARGRAFLVAGWKAKDGVAEQHQEPDPPARTRSLSGALASGR